MPSFSISSSWPFSLKYSDVSSPFANFILDIFVKLSIAVIVSFIFFSFGCSALSLISGAILSIIKVTFVSFFALSVAVNSYNPSSDIAVLFWKFSTTSLFFFKIILSKFSSITSGITDVLYIFLFSTPIISEAFVSGSGVGSGFLSSIPVTSLVIIALYPFSSSMYMLIVQFFSTVYFPVTSLPFSILIFSPFVLK